MFILSKNDKFPKIGSKESQFLSFKNVNYQNNFVFPLSCLFNEVLNNIIYNVLFWFIWNAGYLSPQVDLRNISLQNFEYLSIILLQWLHVTFTLLFNQIVPTPNHTNYYEVCLSISSSLYLCILLLFASFDSSNFSITANF